MREAVEQAIAAAQVEHAQIRLGPRIGGCSCGWRPSDDRRGRLNTDQHAAHFAAIALDAALAAGCLLPDQPERVGFLCHVCGLRAGTGATEDHGEFCSVGGAAIPVFILRGAHDAD